MSKDIRSDKELIEAVEVFLFMRIKRASTSLHSSYMTDL